MVIDKKGLFKENVFIVLSWWVALAVSVVMFFIVIPWVCSAVPGGDWKRFVDIMIFIFLGLPIGFSLPVIIGVSLTKVILITFNK